MILLNLMISHNFVKVFFFLLILPLSLIAQDDFDLLKENYFQGKYQLVLEEYEVLYQCWQKEGKFGAYLRSRFESIRDGLDVFKENLKTRKKHREEIQRLEQEKNRALTNLCQQYPELKISEIARRIVHYHELNLEYEDAVTFLGLLEMGVADIPREDPAATKIFQMLNKYHLKTVIISSRLRDFLIDVEDARLHNTIMNIDKWYKLKKLCQAHPESPVARKCLDAIKVEEAKLPVAYEQKYLGDLLVGLRAPCNPVEDQVRRIVKSAYLKKMEIIDNG